MKINTSQLCKEINEPFQVLSVKLGTINSPHLVLSTCNQQFLENSPLPSAVRIFFARPFWKKKKICDRCKISLKFVSLWYLAKGFTDSGYRWTGKLAYSRVFIYSFFPYVHVKNACLSGNALLRRRAADVRNVSFPNLLRRLIFPSPRGTIFFRVGLLKLRH